MYQQVLLGVGVTLVITLVLTAFVIWERVKIRRRNQLALLHQKIETRLETIGSDECDELRRSNPAFDSTYRAFQKSNMNSWSQPESTLSAQLSELQQIDDDLNDSLSEDTVDFHPAQNGAA